MKKLFLFAIISGAILINSGCANKLTSFEKRKYNKGYHVDFTERNNKKIRTNFAESDIQIPKQDAKEIYSASIETNCQQLPEIFSEQNFIFKEETASANPAKVFAANKNKKQFQLPLLNKVSGAKIKSDIKNGISNLFPAKNTAGVNQTTSTNVFTYAGMLIGGGSLVALIVMLFSPWASTLLLILLISGVAVGLLLLVAGANYGGR